MKYKLVDCSTDEVVAQSDYAMLVLTMASQYYGEQLVWQSGNNRNIVYGYKLRQFGNQNMVDTSTLVCRIEWER